MTRAVLFDVDGTLVDSVDAHARAWAAAFAEAGYPIPIERIRPLIGMGGDRILPALIPSLREDREPGKTIAARRAAIFRERELPSVRPARGARELLLAVRARRARVVVASSAKKDELDGLLARGDLGPLVDVASTCDDADSSKPAPDIVDAAPIPQRSLEPRRFIAIRPSSPIPWMRRRSRGRAPRRLPCRDPSSRTASRRTRSSRCARRDAAGRRAPAQRAARRVR